MFDLANAMKNWKPIFIENSMIPVWLSKLAPIEIGAITLGFLVISRGEMDDRLRNHETIHYQQYLDLLFFGFVFLYLWDWLVGLFWHRHGKIAYYSIRAEQEAYLNDNDYNYLANRKRWAWIWNHKVKSPPYLEKLLDLEATEEKSDV